MVSNIDPTLNSGTTKDGRDIDKAQLEAAFQAAKDEIDAQQLLTVDFVGDSGSGGVKGLVPAPAGGDSGKFLKGNGTWTTLPGGGDMLSTNNLSDVASATTAATNLGLGTGSSPQFTAVNVGAASDTTLARSGAGVLTVEGNEIYAAGGTDVPVADGGTGSSTAGGALTNLGAAASGANSDITSLSALSTPLTVAQGGIGVGTLTDGGILLGSGTSAVTAMGVLADGAIVVGDGTTDPVALTAFDSSTGNLLGAKGGSIGQQTIWVPAGAMEAAVSTAPAVSNAVEIGTSLFAARTMDFADGSDLFCYFGIQMPKSWDAGALVLQFVWSATGTNGNTVAWAAAATSLGDDEALTTAFPTPTVATADTNSTTADDIMISAEVSVTVGSTPTAEDYVIFEISRDVSADTLAEAARLHGIKIHYTVDTGIDT